MRTRKGGGLPRNAVPTVRGPFVRLPPHPQACVTEPELLKFARRQKRKGPVAADLFCGAGGFSLGLEAAGYRVVYAADNDPNALETHRHLFGGLTEQCDLGDPSTIRRIARLLREIDVDLICCGPPCQPFSRAGRSMVRCLVRDGRRDPRDHRRYLWSSFLDVVQMVRPPAILMENVPDMVLDRDMAILRLFVDALEKLGYSVGSRLIDTWRLGVPQVRQRLIITALRNGAAFVWPEDVPQAVTLRDAIGDLPPVEGGWRPENGAAGYLPYKNPRSEFQARMRQGVTAEMADRVYDHITRPVREDDARAFAHMDSRTRYGDLPEDVKRYREDIFQDKYKRLDFERVSRTITAHIAKDGYWYIHPKEDRTITIREAARIQTFPDHVRFAGPPSFAFKQIGNAVPPLLAEKLGVAVRHSIVAGRSASPSTAMIRDALAKWLVARHRRGELSVPWYGLSVPYMAKGRIPPVSLRWVVLASQFLFERSSIDNVFRRVWPVFRKEFARPEWVLRREPLLRQLAHGLGRVGRVNAVLEAAAHLNSSPDQLRTVDALREIPGVNERTASLVARIVPAPGDDPIVVFDGVLRVAARFSGSDVDRVNKFSWGRVEVARLVGCDAGSGARRSCNAALAHLALFDLAEAVCRVENPRCGECPLAGGCVSREGFENRRADVQQQVMFA